MVDYYTVALVNGTGISSVTGAGTYLKGSNVAISATLADSTYLWGKWVQTSGGATLSTEEAYAVTGINKPCSLTATAVLDVYTATVTVNQNGKRMDGNRNACHDAF